jgi:hypothetical protein
MVSSVAGEGMQIRHSLQVMPALILIGIGSLPFCLRAHANTPPDDAVPAESRPINYDDLGLIVHRDGQGAIDGGDTAQREGWYWFGVWIRGHTPGMTRWPEKRTLTFEQVLRLLEPKGDGVFVRHPKQYPNAFDKQWGMSRDQLIPLIAAMGVWGKNAELHRLYDALPEDLVGKHAFNGNFRNWLGQDGEDCREIKKRGRDATRDCSLNVDTRDCSLASDNRDCSLQVDTRNCSQQFDDRDCSLRVDNTDCSLQVDTRSCGHDLAFGIHINDPVCEAAKAAQNAAYSGAKAACEAQKVAKNVDYSRLKATCEAAKTSQNSIYAAQKGACETAKAAQKAAYSAAKATCEGAKSSQNVLYYAQKNQCEVAKGVQNGVYAAGKASCESAKTGGKYLCELDKQTAYQACRTGNVYSGDLIGPSTVNLFRRAFNSDPLAAFGSTATITIAQGGMAGEVELLVNAHLRAAQTQTNKDDVGDDLNLIVMLLMAKLRHPSLVSNEAMAVYSQQRPASYGSFLGAYYKQYGSDLSDIVNRMNAGIASGQWGEDVSHPYGAVRWYHRPSTGANPQLAILYKPIIDFYIK